MGAKSEQKKKLIRDTARRVFMEKGYKNVTMKDIVEACRISRGGLYLYYSSTAELFLEVLKMESEDSDDELVLAIRSGASPRDILELFLQEQKKELLREEDTLVIATYEYAFAEKEKGEAGKDAEEPSYLGNRFAQTLQVLEYLLTEGGKMGQFDCPDVEAEARSILYTLEGLKIAAHTVGLSEKQVDEAMDYLLFRIVKAA